jgi:hypothetical protein
MVDRVEIPKSIIATVIPSGWRGLQTSSNHSWLSSGIHEVFGHRDKIGHMRCLNN